MSACGLRETTEKCGSPSFLGMVSIPALSALLLMPSNSGRAALMVVSSNSARATLMLMTSGSGLSRLAPCFQILRCQQKPRQKGILADNFGKLDQTNSTIEALKMNFADKCLFFAKNHHLFSSFKLKLLTAPAFRFANSAKRQVSRHFR
jgi:hypothetical protein